MQQFRVSWRTQIVSVSFEAFEKTGVEYMCPEFRKFCAKGKRRKVHAGEILVKKCTLALHSEAWFIEEARRHGKPIGIGECRLMLTAWRRARRKGKKPWPRELFFVIKRGKKRLPVSVQASKNGFYFYAVTPQHGLTGSSILTHGGVAASRKKK